MKATRKAKSSAGSDAAAADASAKPDRGSGDTVARIVGVLRERISLHQAPPGMQLREVALAAEFNVSRARIRDALAALDSRGLVERIPSRGAIVKRPDFDHIRNLFDMREVLEGLAARLATQNSEPRSWQKLVELFGEPTEKALKNGDFEFYIRNYEYFRRAVIKAADSAPLAESLSTLHDQTKMLMRRIIIMSDRGMQALEENRACLLAMRNGCAQEAEALRRKTISSARICLERYREFLL